MNLDRQVLSCNAHIHNLICVKENVYSIVLQM